uniref:acid phosphatase n=1 Tax=Romanomermis culicivorax TaxID=13658 RepID=A0A915JVL4_ROMCU
MPDISLFLLQISSLHFQLTFASKLVFVHLIYRHGDRYPSKTFPNDVNKKFFEKMGWSQLTKKGMAQTYELGKFLRLRYGNFLSTEYIRDEIYVRSTDKDRSLQSALCAVAGLYEYQIDEYPCPGLFLPTFVPVPVHTVPVNQDALLEMDTYCPLYDEYVHNYTLPEFKKISEQYRII